jgi:hypothetical protein
MEPPGKAGVLMPMPGRAEARSARFSAEADMLAPLLGHARSLIQGLAGQFEIFFEVQSAAGVPDVVLAAFDDREMANRERRGLVPLADAADVAVMTVLGASAARPHRDIAWTPARLAVYTGLTAGYLSSVVLRRLAEQGHVKRIARGQWVSTHPFKPLARHVIVVETKRSDWRGGFWQAHRQAADRRWLVVDAAHGAAAAAKAEQFTRSGVGLATLSVASDMAVIVSPQDRASHDANRNLLIERTAALRMSGRVSGPVRHVFGRDLIATKGVDPRLQGAGAR